MAALCYATLSEAAMLDLFFAMAGMALLLPNVVITCMIVMMWHAPERDTTGVIVRGLLSAALMGVSRGRRHMFCLEVRDNTTILYFFTVMPVT